MAHVDPMAPIDPPPLPQRPESSHRRNASRLSTHEDAGDDLDALIAINQELADMGLDRDRFGSRSMMMYRSNTLLNRDQFARRLASQSVSNSVSMAARASSPSLPAASERENVASVPSVFLRSHSAQPSVEDSLPLPHFKLDEPSGADVGMAQCVLFGRIQNIELSHAFSGDMVNLQLKCGGRSTEISFAADNQVLSKSCQCLSMLVQNYAGNMLCELKLEINRLAYVGDQALHAYFPLRDARLTYRLKELQPLTTLDRYLAATQPELCTHYSQFAEFATWINPAIKSMNEISTSASDHVKSAVDGIATSTTTNSCQNQQFGQIERAFQNASQTSSGRICALDQLQQPCEREGSESPSSARPNPASFSPTLLSLSSSQVHPLESHVAASIVEFAQPFKQALSQFQTTSTSNSNSSCYPSLQVLRKLVLPLSARSASSSKSSSPTVIGKITIEISILPVPSYESLDVDDVDFVLPLNDSESPHVNGGTNVSSQHGLEQGNFLLPVPPRRLAPVSNLQPSRNFHFHRPVRKISDSLDDFAHDLKHHVSVVQWSCLAQSCLRFQAALGRWNFPLCANSDGTRPDFLNAIWNPKTRPDKFDLFDFDVQSGRRASSTDQFGRSWWHHFLIRCSSQPFADRDLLSAMFWLHSFLVKRSKQQICVRDHLAQRTPLHYLAMFGAIEPSADLSSSSFSEPNQSVSRRLFIFLNAANISSASHLSSSLDGEAHSNGMIIKASTWSDAPLTTAVALARLTLDACANLRVRVAMLEARDAYGRTALHYAFERGDSALASFLLDAINRCRSLMKSSLLYSTRLSTLSRNSVEMPDMCGCTPLMLCLDHHQFNCLPKLLQSMQSSWNFDVFNDQSYSNRYEGPRSSQFSQTAMELLPMHVQLVLHTAASSSSSSCDSVGDFLSLPSYSKLPTDISSKLLPSQQATSMLHRIGLHSWTILSSLHQSHRPKTGEKEVDAFTPFHWLCASPYAVHGWIHILNGLPAVVFPLLMSISDSHGRTPLEYLILMQSSHSPSSAGSLNFKDLDFPSILLNDVLVPLLDSFHQDWQIQTELHETSPTIFQASLENDSSNAEDVVCFFDDNYQFTAIGDDDLQSSSRVISNDSVSLDHIILPSVSLHHCSSSVNHRLMNELFTNLASSIPLDESKFFNAAGSNNGKHAVDDLSHNQLASYVTSSPSSLEATSATASDQITSSLESATTSCHSASSLESNLSSSGTQVMDRSQLSLARQRCIDSVVEVLSEPLQFTQHATLKSTEQSHLLKPREVRSVASALLQHYRFDAERVLLNCLENLAQTCSKANISLFCRTAFASDSCEKFICSICSDEFPSSKGFSVCEQHVFDEECWRNHLLAKLDDGPTAIMARCPAINCKATVCESFWEVIFESSPDVLRRYRQYLVDSFVNCRQSSIHWCPQPGCEKALILSCGDDYLDTLNQMSDDVHSMTLATGAPQIECTCGALLCGLCFVDAHAPVTCSQQQQWQEEMLSQSSDDLKAIMRECRGCPRCKVVIYRTEGCNHMVCANCQYNFCWKCKGDWKQHGTQTGGFYECKMFDPIKHSEVNMLDTSTSRVNRFVQFLHRSESHSESRQLAREKIKSLGNSSQNTIASDSSWLSLIQNERVAEVARLALNRLVQLRRFLECGYWALYFAYEGPVSSDDETSSSSNEVDNEKLFSDMQANLHFCLQSMEMNVELLTELIERRVDKLSMDDVQRLVDVCLVRQTQVCDLIVHQREQLQLLNSKSRPSESLNSL